MHVCIFSNLVSFVISFVQHQYSNAYNYSKVSELSLSMDILNLIRLDENLRRISFALQYCAYNSQGNLKQMSSKISFCNVKIEKNKICSTG
jgi:hypothetical protein